MIDLAGDRLAAAFEGLYRFLAFESDEPWEDNEALDAAATGYKRLVAIAAEVRGEQGQGDAAAQAPYRERFRDALADDLNAPKAMAVVWEVARKSDLSAADRRDLLLAFDETLGLNLAEAEVEDSAGESDPRIDALVAERAAARVAKDFATSDRIRDELAAEGIAIVDFPDGPRWSRQ